MEDLAGVSTWDPQQTQASGQVARKAFDESAVVVPEEGSEELLRAMGIIGERPPPPPPPPPPVWEGNTGLDALMDLLNAPLPEPAGVPAYGYGGQARAPEPEADASFPLPRLRDAPGSEDVLPDADSAGGRSTGRSDPQSGFPHSELARQKVRMQNQEDARAAARRRLNEFRHRNDKEQAEHDHVVSRQKQVEQHGQQTRTARGLGNRLAEIRAKQEADRRKS